MNIFVFYILFTLRPFNFYLFHHNSQHSIPFFIPSVLPSFINFILCLFLVLLYPFLFLLVFICLIFFVPFSLSILSLPFSFDSLLAYLSFFFFLYRTFSHSAPFPLSYCFFAAFPFTFSSSSSFLFSTHLLFLSSPTNTLPPCPALPPNTE